MNFRFREPAHAEEAAELRFCRSTERSRITPTRKSNHARKARRTNRVQGRALSRLVIGTLAIAFLSVAGGYFAVVQGNREVQSELDKLRALGAIVDSAQIDAIPRIPESENALRPYLGAISQLQLIERSLKGDVTSIGSTGGTLAQRILHGEATEAQIAAAKQVLNKEADALRAFEDASRLPHLQFHRDYTLAFATLLPEYSQMKNAVRRLDLRAALEAKEGNWVAASEDLAASVRIANHIGEDLPFIAALVQASAMSDNFLVCQGILERYGKTPAAVNAVRAALAAARPPKPLRDWYKLEPLMGAQLKQVAELWERGDPRVRGSGDINAPNYRLLLVPGLGSAIQARVLLSDRLQIEEAMATEGDFGGLKDRLSLLDRDQSRDIVGAAASSYTGFFANAAEVLGAMQAERRTLEAAIAALDVRQKTGGWPKNDRMVAVDPLGRGRPLHIRMDGANYAVWSVGRNGLDDGGVNNHKATGGPDADDIAVHLSAETP